MNKESFDRLFDTAFEISAQQPPDYTSVDHRPSWHRVQHQLIAKRRRTNIRTKLTRLSVVAASLLLGAVIFGNSQAVKALEPLYATLKEYPSGVMGFIFGRSEDTDTSKAKTLPPPEFAEGLDIQKVNEFIYTSSATEAQASKLLSFPAPVFHYLPAGYSFSQAQLYFINGHDLADEVAYIFLTEEGKTMTIFLKKLNEGTSLGMNSHAEGITVENIQLSSGPAILTTAQNGSSQLETIASGIQINMSGIIPSDELILLYEEMDMK